MRGKSYGEYKGVIIYKKPDDNIFYIYMKPEGKDRVDFESYEAVVDYIDSMKEPIIKREKETKTFRVWFQNSVGREEYINIETSDPDKAKALAKKKLGYEVKRIIKVVSDN